MDRKSVMGKIRKCLALSESSNENEAAAALQHAYKLMEKYGISLNDIELSQIEEIMSASFKVQKPPVYYCHLAKGIADIFGCETILVRKWASSRIVFIGLGFNAEVASYAFDVLRKQLDKGRKNYIESLSKRMKKASKTARANAWADGWFISVWQKVSALAPHKKPEDLIKTYMDQNMGELGVYKAKESKLARSDMESFLGGVKAGAEVEINPAVGQREKAKMIEA